MNTVIELTNEATIDTIIYKINEHSNKIRTNELAIIELCKYDSQTELATFKEQQKQTEELKKHFDEGLSKHSIEIFKTISELSEKINQLDKEVNALKYKPEKDAKKLVDKIKNEISDKAIQYIVSVTVTAVGAALLYTIIKNS